MAGSNFPHVIASLSARIAHILKVPLT
jgi:hypothetical protein